MEVDGVDHQGADRLYEIGLEGDVCDAVRRANLGARVASAATSTILWSRLRHSDELYLLLDALSDFGLTPREIHVSGALRPELPCPAGSAESVNVQLAYGEVRIGGRLGAAALHHLRWSHRVVQTTVVTVCASPARLRTVLAQMSTLTGVDYVVALCDG